MGRAWREIVLLAVVGLGNPGTEYENTRHNIGYRVVESVAGGGTLFENRRDYLFVGSKVRGRKVLLVKPTTYMNLSGHAVSRILSEFGIDPPGMLIVSDDANLPLGRIRIRRQGGDGGQKGLASIISEIGTDRFARLRLGIGVPGVDVDLADHVLRPFLDQELEEVDRMLTESVRCVQTWVAKGIRCAMDRLNRADRQDPPRGENEGVTEES